jgi:hypothetical protein
VASLFSQKLQEKPPDNVMNGGLAFAWLCACSEAGKGQTTRFLPFVKLTISSSTMTSPNPNLYRSQSRTFIVIPDCFREK